MPEVKIEHRLSELSFAPTCPGYTTFGVWLGGLLDASKTSSFATVAFPLDYPKTVSV